MSLEAAITLDDVFAVVAAKRVPLAAELAGYLALEVADGTDAGSGDVDPKTVFISEEGTVGLVRPKKETVRGDAEASVRTLLVRLLEASGSSTPALGIAAKRKPGNGLPALVEELEAALIPVNRAAGRRALARLSREVKRVTQGVGRNASAAPVQPAAPPPPKLAAAGGRASKWRRRCRSSSRRSSSWPRGSRRSRSTIPSRRRRSRRSPSRRPFRRRRARSSRSRRRLRRSRSARPFRRRALLSEDELEAQLSAAMSPAVPVREPTKAKNDDVDALLAQFEVSSMADDKQLGRDLKAMAGLSPTPPHPELKGIADLGRDVGKGSLRASLSGDQDSVAELLALADASLPAPAVTANEGLPPVNEKADARRRSEAEPTGAGRRARDLAPVRAGPAAEPELVAASAAEAAPKSEPVFQRDLVQRTSVALPSASTKRRAAAPTSRRARRRRAWCCS